MARLKIAERVVLDREDGVTDVYGEYTFPVNPVEYEKPRYPLIKEIDTLDGRKGYHHAPYNHALRTMKWGILPRHAQYKTMVETLRGYNGHAVFLKEGSAGTDRNEFWVRVLIINVKVTYNKAPNIRNFYRSVELTFAILPNITPEESIIYSVSNMDNWEPPNIIQPGKHEVISEVPTPADP